MRQRIELRRAIYIVQIIIAGKAGQSRAIVRVDNNLPVHRGVIDDGVVNGLPISGTIIIDC